MKKIINFKKEGFLSTATEPTRGICLKVLWYADNYETKTLNYASLTNVCRYIAHII